MQNFNETKVFKPTANISSFKTRGKSIEQSVKDFSSTVFYPKTLDNKPKKIIVTFPGRFQPYHKGHAVIFKMLMRMFGEDNIYILPTIRMGTEDLLSFEDRKTLILNTKGISIDQKNVRQRRSKGFDHKGLAKDLGIADKLTEYVFVCVLSIEDDFLIPSKDKETYYQPWPAELYTLTSEQLPKVTKYLPSMKYYGFKFVVDAFGGEIMYDFKKQIQEKSFKQKVMTQLTIREVAICLKENDFSSIKNRLPYDVNLLKDLLKEKMPEEETLKENDVNESILNDQNPAILKKNNKNFWIGCVSILDGIIENVYTYETARQYDFHHSLYFSSIDQERIDNNESGIFWINKKDKTIESTWRNGELPPNIIKDIKKQIIIK